MNRIKAILIGTITGLVVGLFSLALASIGWRLSNAPGHWDRTVTTALLTFCLVQGAVIGSVNGGLCTALCNLEQVIISVLLSLAIGAVRVIPGGFDGRSLLPVAIYGLAFVNGGVTAVALLLILRRTDRVDERNLLIS